MAGDPNTSGRWLLPWPKLRSKLHTSRDLSVLKVSLSMARPRLARRSRAVNKHVFAVRVIRQRIENAFENASVRKMPKTLETPFNFPNRPGKSRHGHPVWMRCKTPSIIPCRNTAVSLF
ncbi:MAG: hypothetical protein OXE85_09990 [Roseovarius sp.]|nr:hypothetical protein [Roseovarius sp.]